MNYMVEKLETELKKLQQAREGYLQGLNNILTLQGTDGNWNSSEYMVGFYNGLELALSILENRNPIYKDVPKEYR